jgi:CRISPR-associated endoribonuclease Cas6
MRIKIEFNKPNQNVPINTQSYVNSFIHKCLGNNNPYHDNKSNYCVSNLKGGKLNDDKQTLSFVNNPYIIVTSEDYHFIGKIIEGTFNNSLPFDMNVIDTSFINETLTNGWNHFFTLDPIILKEYNPEGKQRYITIDDTDFKDKLKSHIINKFTKIDPTLKLNDLQLEVGHGKRKKITIKDNVWAIGSSVKIMVKTNKKVATKLYNYGIGQSTGSGFGTIYTTNHVHEYKF